MKLGCVSKGIKCRLWYAFSLITSHGTDKAANTQATAALLNSLILRLITPSSLRNAHAQQCRDRVFHATCIVDGTCQHTIIRPTCLQANRTSISQGFQGSWNLGYDSSRCAAYFVRVCFDTQTRAQLQRIEASTRLPVSLSQDLPRRVACSRPLCQPEVWQVSGGHGEGGWRSGCFFQLLHHRQQY